MSDDNVESEAAEEGVSALSEGTSAVSEATSPVSEGTSPLSEPVSPISEPVSAVSEPKESSESSPDDEEDVQQALRFFVTLLTVRLMNKCKTPDKRDTVTNCNHIRRLTDIIMTGLGLCEDYCPRAQNVKPLCRLSLKKLEKEFSGRRMLENVLLLQDRAVDAVVARVLRRQVEKCSEHLYKRANACCF